MLYEGENGVQCKSIHRKKILKTFVFFQFDINGRLKNQL